MKLAALLIASYIVSSWLPLEIYCLPSLQKIRTAITQYSDLNPTLSVCMYAHVCPRVYVSATLRHLQEMHSGS